MDPKSSDTIYAAMYDKLRLPWTYQIGGPGSGIHKSTDGGKTWTKLAGGLPAGMLGRIGLTVYPKNPSILYAVIENVNKPGMTPEARWQEILEGKSSAGMIDGEVYRTEDAGATWRKVSPEKQSIGSGPGYYYADIIIDPNDDKHVYALSVGVQESKDGGKTWGSPFRFGGDNHALWIDPADSKHMILGYDHGLGVTFDGGKAWHRPDHLPVAQFYAIDYDMSFPYRVAGGLQDNGSLLGPSSNKNGAAIDYEDWYTIGGGDGMYNVFDKKTNRYLYNESQFGPLSRLDLLTGESKGIAYRGGNQKRFNWNAPIHVSHFDPNVVYHCGNIVVRSANRGESWTEISPDLTTNDKAKMPNGTGGDGNIQYCTITTFAESTLQPGLLWVGTDDGLVWVTSDDGKNWTKVSDKIAGNPGYWVSRVEASSSDPGTAYVAYTGLRNDDFRPFLYKTTDYGQTWTSIAGNLPNEPINVVREDPKNRQLLFVGTDFAVWTSLDGGKTWLKMKANMPTVAIYDLKIHPRESDLIVGHPRPLGLDRGHLGPGRDDPGGHGQGGPPLRRRAPDPLEPRAAARSGRDQPGRRQRAGRDGDQLLPQGQAQGRGQGSGPEGHGGLRRDQGHGRRRDQLRALEHEPGPERCREAGRRGRPESPFRRDGGRSPGAERRVHRGPLRRRPEADDDGGHPARPDREQVGRAAGPRGPGRPARILRGTAPSGRPSFY